jgi:hypothetical protein
MCPRPDCPGRLVGFPVPPDLREYAPAGAARAALCARCLRTFPAGDADPGPSFDAVLDSFPDGEAGAALALALGHLDSLALDREAVVACCEHAERAGADVYLTLDRLAAAGSVDPHFDVDRRKQQLRTYL